MSQGLRRICLVGVRGVGKTTLIRSVIEELPDVDYVVGSAVLRELAGEAFARFDHLPADVKHGYRIAAVDWMMERQAREGRHILCDGHTALLDESTGDVGQVFTDQDCRFFRELILVEAPASVILDRRAQDTAKRRSVDPTIIAREMAAERDTSRVLSEQWSMQLHELPPNTGPLARQRLLELLR